MRSIKTKEEDVLNEFRNVVLENNEGQTSPVTVLYGDSSRIESYILGGFMRIDPMYMAFREQEKSRMPVIGLNTTHIGHNHFIMEGIVHASMRDTFNKIIEQFHHTVELNDKIIISEVTIGNSEFYNSGTHSNVKTLTGRFSVEYRE